MDESVALQVSEPSEPLEHTIPLLSQKAFGQQAALQTRSAAFIGKRTRDESNVLEGLLGSGIYGEVYAIRLYDKASPDGYGPRLAMKLMKTIDINEPEALLRSIEYAREIYGLSTSGLFRGFMACAQTGRLGLLMPVFGQRIGNSVLPVYSVPATAALLRPVAEALARMPGMHRDVKPANICMPSDPSQDATLIDFSLCTNMDRSNDSSVITMWYRPIEALVGLEHTKTADIWSFGIVLLNLLTGLHLNRCATEDSKLCFVMDLLDKFGWPRDWPEFYRLYDASNGSRRGSPIGTFNVEPLIDFSTLKVDCVPDPAAYFHARAATDLLKGILKLKPSERLSWPEILAHPFWTFADQSKKPCKMAVPTRPQNRDGENFLKTSVFVGAYHARPAGPINIEIIDTFLIMCQKLKFTSATAYYAICIWKHALLGAESEILSACVFLAASFNEDLRERHITWGKWISEINEAADTEKRHAKSVIRVLVCTGGFWPAKTWTQAYQELSLLVNGLKPGEHLFENTALYLFGCAADASDASELAHILEGLKVLLDEKN